MAVVRSGDWTVSGGADLEPENVAMRSQRLVRHWPSAMPRTPVGTTMPSAIFAQTVEPMDEVQPMNRPVFE